MTGPVGVNPGPFHPGQLSSGEQDSKKASGQLDLSVSLLPQQRDSTHPSGFHSFRVQEAFAVCRRCWPWGGTGNGPQPGWFPPLGPRAAWLCAGLGVSL